MIAIASGRRDVRVPTQTPLYRTIATEVTGEARVCEGDLPTHRSAEAGRLTSTISSSGSTTAARPSGAIRETGVPGKARPASPWRGRRAASAFTLANEANRREPKQSESQANNFSPARMLFVGPNSAQPRAEFPPIEALAAPGVPIHTALPTSQCEPHSRHRSGLLVLVTRVVGVACRFQTIIAFSGA